MWGEMLSGGWRRGVDTSATEVKAVAEAAGLAPTTLKRAKKRLRVRSSKRPDEWVWRVPVEGG